METILTAFIVLALILFASLTIFTGYLNAQDTLRASWQEMQTRLSDQMHTDLTPILAQTKSSGAVIELTLRNDGDTRLADFADWDVIVEYYTPPGDLAVGWYSYNVGEPAAGEWSVIGIYIDAATAEGEVFEPGILNPGEEVLLRLRALPPVGPSTTNMLTIAAENGVSASMQFVR
ncbi:MAG: hypothetical protein KA362_14925 [Chloroflexi bacterium]|nr:hypothetical protein [Chloroflexota bacterium]MBK6712294.1 hypothetical protein [Chloroflexota bacterium]MBK7178919.1 hypothetical protein [Chloroflexota bacterium]MBK7917044.1 hypothetical protein [Chloroflexota bacterium]MBK8933552.1 hypothetical protein [Chloroflexota bacterium]